MIIVYLVPGTVQQLNRYRNTRTRSWLRTVLASLRAVVVDVLHDEYNPLQRFHVHAFRGFPGHGPQIYFVPVVPKERHVEEISGRILNYLGLISRWEAELKFLVRKWNPVRRFHVLPFRVFPVPESLYSTSSQERHVERKQWTVESFPNL